MSAVRVVLADDQEMVRAGLRMLIDFQPDLEVVGEAADGVEAVDVVTRLRPDVVLMDVRMPRCDGIEAAAACSPRAGHEGRRADDLRRGRLAGRGAAGG